MLPTQASNWSALLQQLLLLSTAAASFGSGAYAFHGGLASAASSSSGSRIVAQDVAAHKAAGYRKTLGYGPQHPSALHEPGNKASDSLYTTFATASSGVHADLKDGASAASRLLNSLNDELASYAQLASNTPPLSRHPSLSERVQQSAQWLLLSLTPSDAPPLLSPALSAARQVEWRIREDSYVDTSSGISHVYARAIVTPENREIVNADVNINIAPDGKILSYGNSLYVDAIDNTVRFAAATSSDASHDFTMNLDQDGMGKAKLVDPRLALAHFLAEASPFGSYAVDLDARAEAYAAAMRTRSPRKDDSSGKTDTYTITSAPLTMDPVYAKLAYLQVPADDGIGMELQLVWKMEVPMRDNSYEACLLATMAAPGEASVKDYDSQLGRGRTLSVVDWVQSMPAAHRTVQLEAKRDLTALTWTHLQETSASIGNKAANGMQALEQNIAALLEQGGVYLEQDADSVDADPLSKPPVSITEQVDDHVNGDELALQDFPRDPMLKVFKWGFNDPTDGVRSIENGVRPHSPASPLGWHRTLLRSDPFANSDGDSHSARHGKGHGGRTQPRHEDGKYVVYKDTRGNNVLASADPVGAGDWEGAKRPIAKRISSSRSGSSKDEGDDEWIFDFPFPWRAYDKNHTELDPSVYSDASTTQLFYLCNKYHDFLWGYGFDELSGNFQADNFGRGGAGNDPVIAFSQDGAGMNNADFMTPPDGRKPRMRMYKWSSTPQRDGDFEEGIVIHEYSHGLSTRLTGGPANSGCLGWGEAGGFGEGQGDAFATIIRRKHAKAHDWTMGEWASHTKGGIRKYPYSTNMTVDKELYSDLDKPGYGFSVHAIGEVWAGMVNELVEGLILKHGFTPDLFVPLPNATQADADAFFLREDETPKQRTSTRRIPRHGNSLAVQLLMDGMKLQPCRPGFHDMRDAILQADENLTNGNNTCVIWTAFAKRGLGTDSKIELQTPWGGGVRTDGFKIPKKCQAAQH